MKLAVVGSRTFNDYPYLKKMLQWHSCSMIVSGGAKGADLLAKRYAAENDIPVREYPPDWKLYGKSAGYKRNVLIVNDCDELVAFWDGISKGNRLSIDLAKKDNKPVYVYWPDLDSMLDDIGL